MSSRPKGGPMGGGPGRNIGAKGPKPKNFWKTVKRYFHTCLNECCQLLLS